MAMLGIASSIIGEVLTGKGALAQLGFETGLPIFDLDGLILAVIGFNLIAALLPAKGKFIPDDEELLERPAGALQSSKVSLATPGAFFGIKGFGFTKENELFVGRMAHVRLREEMQRTLGDKFSLGRYHEAALSHGSIPMKYLAELVRANPAAAAK